jgi:hypothetical protein
MWWFHWIRKTGKFQLTLEVGPIVNHIQELVAAMWKSAWGKGNGIVEVLHKVAPTA